MAWVIVQWLHYDKGGVFVATIYGWLAFGEVLSGLDIVGMMLAGAALAVARAKA